MRKDQIEAKLQVDRARHHILFLLGGSPAADPTSRTRYIRVLALSTALLGRPRPSWRAHLTRGLACRGPNITDPIYSNAHPQRIGFIGCAIFIDHVSYIRHLIKTRIHKQSQSS
jgi:hypothetical protein